METEKKYNVSKTLLQQLTEVTTLAVARFIIYYYTPEDRRKKWDDFKGCDSLIKTHTYEDCLEWLQREDAQKALQVYHKVNRTYEMTRLYDSMLKKAMDGDTKAASWIQSFLKSDYFKDSSNEVDSFMQGINIEGLK